MHSIDDKANGIVINHNSDWSGEVHVAWYSASAHEQLGRAGVPPSLQECECRGIDLIAGRFTLCEGPEPPVNVITRAVALAVETHLRNKMLRAAEDLFIDRGKL